MRCLLVHAASLHVLFLFVWFLSSLCSCGWSAVCFVVAGNACLLQLPALLNTYVSSFNENDENEEAAMQAAQAQAQKWRKEDEDGKSKKKKKK